jgi:hypothetical protein
MTLKWFASLSCMDTLCGNCSMIEKEVKEHMLIFAFLSSAGVIIISPTDVNEC